MMDHLTTTPHRLCELLALENVGSPGEAVEIMTHPAVRDLVIDFTGAAGVMRYRIRPKPSEIETEKLSDGQKLLPTPFPCPYPKVK